jgi:hypothetical protein
MEIGVEQIVELLWGRATFNIDDCQSLSGQAVQLATQ